MLFQRHAWTSVLWLLLAVTLTSCGEKKEEESEEQEPVITEHMKNPIGALSIAALAVTSAGEHVGTTTATLTTHEGWHAEDYCVGDTGYPRWQTGDGDEHKSPYEGDVFMLNRTHPRAALQHFFCMLSSDTGNNSTFVGTITGTKLYACFVSEEYLDFSGQEQSVPFDATKVRACWKNELGLSDQQLDEMLPEGTDVNVKVTSKAPAAFGGENWDGSILIHASNDSGLDETIKLLLRDSGQRFGVAILTASGRPTPTDAVRVGINRETGEVFYEGKFQRMRVSYSDVEENRRNSIGWNRAGVGYAKGTITEDYLFSEVSNFFGAHSDISKEAANEFFDDVARGHFWTIDGGSGDAGAVTYSYDLTCPGDGECSDPNLAASWTAVNEATTAACNGVAASTESSTCTGEGIQVSTDAHTAFVMHPENAAYELTEDWFGATGFPAFTSLTLGFKQQ